MITVDKYQIAVFCLNSYIQYRMSSNQASGYVINPPLSLHRSLLAVETLSLQRMLSVIHVTALPLCRSPVAVGTCTSSVFAVCHSFNHHLVPSRYWQWKLVSLQHMLSVIHETIRLSLCRLSASHGTIVPSRCRSPVAVGTCVHHQRLLSVSHLTISSFQVNSGSGNK